MKTYYQEIAPDYARYRRIHPEVLRGLITNSAIHSDSRVLEVGCGTGNYICALRQSVGCHCWGIDPSEQMLEQAMNRSCSVQFANGRAENLAFDGEAFDLVFSVDVIHHISDRAKAFSDAARVMRRGGRLCVVTDSAEIIKNRQPLSVYFPESIEIELSRYPAVDLLRKEMAAAGFGELSEKVVEFSTVLPDIEPYRAKVFSSLRLIPDEAFIRGMERLENDFNQGPVPWISRYLMLWGIKLRD